jgi:hypothetical protein
MTDFERGYRRALQDFGELLDNAVANWDGDSAVWHWDFELRDQIMVLEDMFEFEMETGGFDDG